MHEEISRSEARARHDSGALYNVPTCRIELNRHIELNRRIELLCIYKIYKVYKIYKTTKITKLTKYELCNLYVLQNKSLIFVVEIL